MTLESTEAANVEKLIFKIMASMRMQAEVYEEVFRLVFIRRHHTGYYEDKLMEDEKILVGLQCGMAESKLKAV
ncbi:G2/mitotic-specific cyclin S13-7-like isoform X2 [Salvia divinorum]|uniref:G2/mitotic-specific cyclin S13-7-like isoform X2 n=1 Tax=Salvia divinorum TaxID=28513 RepID=A0ABD1GNP9_SALDI